MTHEIRGTTVREKAGLVSLHTETTGLKRLCMFAFCIKMRGDEANILEDTWRCKERREGNEVEKRIDNVRV